MQVIFNSHFKITLFNPNFCVKKLRFFSGTVKVKFYYNSKIYDTGKKIQLFNIKIGIEKRNFKVWIENHLHLILGLDIIKLLLW